MPKIQINDREIDLNHDTEAKLGNFKNLLLNDVPIVSSVLARKLKCSSSARLGTFIARLGSSWKNPARAHHYYLAVSFKILINIEDF